MNKKILFAFLSLLISVPIITLAQTADVDPQGSSSCVSISNNLRYRTTDAQTSGDVSVLQDFLQANGYLKASPSGYMGLLTVKGVKSFQSDNGISPTGYVGQLTRGKIQTVSCAGPTVNVSKNTTSNNQNGTTLVSGCALGAMFSSTTGASCSGAVTTNQNNTQYTIPTTQPSITVVSAPANLQINDTGTWQVKINYPTNNLANSSFYAVWGDEQTPPSSPVYVGPNNTSGADDSAKFYHAYKNAGTYKPIFTVINQNNQSASTSTNVNVGKINSPTTINPTSIPFISMISPIGGETLIQSGTNQTTTNTISWNGWGFGTVHVFLTSADATTVNTLSLGVIWSGTPTNTNSIIWDGKTVCQSWFGNSGSNCNVVSPGSYKIYIVGDLTTGGTVNAVSNSSFSILRQPSTTIPSSPISVNNGKCGLMVNSLQANDKVSFPLVVTGNIDNSNSQGLGCAWQMFEGQAGSAQLYFNYQNQGWKPVGTSAPIKVSDWTATKTSFSTTLDFNNGGIGLPNGTPMKITFTEENAAGLPSADTFDLPIKF